MVLAESQNNERRGSKLLKDQELCSLCLTTKAEEGLPTSDFRLPTSDFRLPTSDFSLQASGFRLQTSDFSLQTSDFRLQTSDFRLQTADFRLQTSDFRLQTSKFKASIFDETYTKHGPRSWTTPNFQKEIEMKIYRRSGNEKHRLVFIAYVLEGLFPKSGLLWDRARHKWEDHFSAMSLRSAAEETLSSNQQKDNNT